MKRKYPYHLFFIVVAIVFGLTVKEYGSIFNADIADAVGDILWAFMFFWIFGLVFRSRSTIVIATISFLFSFAIEFSQLYQAPFINSVRATFIGGLILGYNFVWTDLLWYSIGIFAGALIEIMIIRSAISNSKST